MERRAILELEGNDSAQSSRPLTDQVFDDWQKDERSKLCLTLMTLASDSAVEETGS
jgi:hypothetical protein